MAALISIFGVAILGAWFIRFLYPKLKLAYQLRQHKFPRGDIKKKRHQTKTRSDLYEDEDELEIERMPDMELYTDVGKFVVQRN